MGIVDHMVHAEPSVFQILIERFTMECFGEVGVGKQAYRKFLKNESEVMSIPV